MAETEPQSETMVETETDTEIETESETEEKKVTPFMQVDGDDKLTVKIGDATSGFQDVDDIMNKNTWNIGTKQKQIQVTADFSGVNLEKERSVEIVIPKGYRILAYSAKDDTPNVDGILKLGLSPNDQAKINDIELTDMDGGDWTAQQVSGYLPTGASVEKNFRTYSGNVKYTFHQNCDQITLTLTLELVQNIMPHAASSTVLDKIQVWMSSGSNSLSTDLETTVTGLLTPYPYRFIETTIPRLVEGDVTSGNVDEMILSNGLWIHSGTTGEQQIYVDEMKYVYSYPEGADFKGFYSSVINIGDRKNFAGGTYANGHLTVTNDTINRKVIFEFNKVSIIHGIPLVTYWSANMHTAVGGTWDGSDKILKFPIEFDLETGAAIDKPLPHLQRTYSPNDIVVKQAGWDIVLTPQNKVRKDLNWNGDYPYDFLVGNIDINVIGPSRPENLNYKWEFDPNLAVRSVGFPSGRPEDTLININAVVENGSGGTRTVTLPGPLVGTTNKYRHTLVSAAQLGLAEGEFITELTAKQTALSYSNYPTGYVYAAGSYYGRFQNGNTGQAKLTITDDNGFMVTATDQSTLGWDHTGAGSSSLTAVKSDGTTGSWYPGDELTLSSSISSGVGVSQSNVIVDPDIYISLPEGINLNTNSVRGISTSGNYGGAEFELDLVNTETKLINGVNWTVYHFRVKNHQDMIAMANDSMVESNAKLSNKVVFKINVSSACKAYPELKPIDIVFWDLGRKAVNATSGTTFVITDKYEITGKGTAYTGMGATTSTEFQVVQKPGLEVRLGMRTVGSGVDYYAYDGTDATIAPVSSRSNAEVSLTYENTSDSAYFVGSEIYLPIPKKGIGYDSFFNNIANDPYNNTDQRTPEYNLYLEAPITLPGFDTFYSVDASTTVNGGEATTSWVPINATWYAAGSLPAGKTLRDVTMVKFVANGNINSGVMDSTSFEVSLDPAAKIGMKNFWRSYQKGWRTAAGAGTWLFGSILAAEPAKAGVEGQVFYDENVNAIYDAAESAGNPSGTLSAR